MTYCPSQPECDEIITMNKNKNKNNGKFILTSSKFSRIFVCFLENNEIILMCTIITYINRACLLFY